MDNVVVAVYDNFADAQKACQALLDVGFTQANAQINPPSEVGAGERVDEREESGIGHFFRSLFGADDDEDREQRDMYAESVRRGSYVLTARAESEQQADEAVAIMNRFDPVDIDQRASHWRSQGWTAYDESAPMLKPDEITRERSTYATGSSADTGKQKIPVIQEELKIGKRAVQRGGVRIIQRVTDTPVQESVNLREEEVTIERRPVNEPASEADLAAFKEGTIELTESAEEPVVSKSARVVEEVVVGKEVRDRTETVSDTVRSTDVEVERMGAAGSTDDLDFRSHWQTSYAGQGGRYEDYDDAYRYGTQIAGNEQYRGRQWTEIEPNLRSDWESTHPGNAWERVKDAVRYGTERVAGKRRG